MKTDGLPADGRIAGVDYGSVRIGLAITDPRQMISSPHCNYTRQDANADLEFLRRFVVEEQVVGFVVGLPIHSSGEESEKSQEARSFGAWLCSEIHLPVVFFDERFSSLAADRYLAAGGLTAKQRKKRRDMLAAQVILAGYLESARDGESAGPLSDPGDLR